MVLKKVLNPGGAFTTLVPVYPHGTDPSSDNPFDQPVPLRQTMRNGYIVTGMQANSSVPGQLGQQAPGQFAAKTAQFTVADNNFATGRVVVVLGEHKITNGFDYVLGGGVNATATAVAAAINRIPGYTAAAVAADVTINYHDGPVDVVEFRVIHYGDRANFTPLVPDTGFMATGVPQIDPPTAG